MQGNGSYAVPPLLPQPAGLSNGSIIGIAAAAVFATLAAAAFTAHWVNLSKRRENSKKGGSKRDLDWPGALRSYAELDFQSGPDGRRVVLGKGAFGVVSDCHLMSLQAFFQHVTTCSCQAKP